MDSSKQLIDLYNELAALQGVDKMSEAQALLKERFAQLPEDIQGELIARLYLGSLVERVEQQDAIAMVQQKGIDMLDALEVLKKNIENKK